MPTVTPQQVVWGPVSVQPVTGSQVGAGGEQTVRLEFDPLGAGTGGVGWIDPQAGGTAALEGTPGSTAYGWWGRIGAYGWYITHVDGGGRAVGVNPQPDEAALAGATMAAWAFAAGNHSPTAVATSFESWVGANTPYTAVRTGTQVDVTGDFDATAVVTGTAWGSRGASGCIGARDLQYTSSFGLDTMRFHTIDNSRLPASLQGPVRIVGMRVRRGTDVTNPLRMCVAIGGVHGDLDGASVPVQIAVPANGGASEWSDILFAPSEVVYADLTPSTGDVVSIGMMGDGATSSIPAESLGSTAVDPHFYRNGSSQVLWIYASPSGSGTSFPSTISGTHTSSNGFVVPVQLIVQRPPYYGDGQWRSYCGPTPGRNDTGLSSTSQMNGIWVGWAYTMPSLDNLRAYEVGINLATHDGTQQARLELWDNVVDPTDPAGETLHHDFGPTSGSATGWNTLSVAAGVALVGSTDYRLSLKSDGSVPPGDAELAFAAGDHPDQLFDPWGWSARGNLGVAQTETEINDTGSVDTWAIYDEFTVSTSPNAYTSTLQHDPPTNSGGVYMLIGMGGVSITPNP